MDTKKVFSWLLFLIGEAIIIAAFVLFKGELTTDVLILNMVVSTIIYGLFFVDVLVSWVDFKDKSQRRIGAIGLRWLFTWLYTLLAISVMVLCNVIYNLTFTSQLLIHAGLLFLLLLGMFGALNVSDKVHNVYVAETVTQSGMKEMKKAVNNLKNKIVESRELPHSVIDRINALEENVRFLSPTNNQEAYELEQSFVDIAKQIEVALTDYSLNQERIERNLEKCERIYQNRKQIYSN